MIISDGDTDQSHAASGGPSKPQIVTDSEADDSDLDFEDVGLDQSATKDTQEDSDILDVSVEVGGKGTPSKPVATRRKPVTTAERRERLAVHKVHLLLLLFHAHIRNSWCNSQQVEVSLHTSL